MRDFRDAKTTAQTLRAALAAMGFKITVSQSLELIAQAFGVADWNTLSAAIRAQATAVPENTSRPPPTAESAKTPGSPPISLPANPLSGELESTLKQAFAHAMGRKHEEVTVEHLLLFLLDDTDASRVMKASGVNLEEFAGHYSGQPWVSESVMLPWAGGLVSLALPTDDPVAGLQFFKPKGGDVFRRVRDDGSEAEEITFTRDASGKISGYMHFSNPTKRMP